MSFSSCGFLGTSVFKDLDVDGSVEYLLIANGEPYTLYGIEVDNSQNSVDVYVKVWDSASGISVGTTEPEFVFKVEAGETLLQPLTSDGSGHTLVAGLAVACVTTGGASGTTSPTNDVTATLITD